MEDIQVTRHPVEWSVEHLARWRGQPGARPRPSALPVPRRIGLRDVRRALAAGYDDFKACRTDVIFLCVIYPLIGLLLGRLTFGEGLMHLAFPLTAGFALLGPLLATGLYEMSRQRESGAPVSWASAFDAFRSPAIGSILALGLMLLVIFAAWLGTAQLIYQTAFGKMAGHVASLPIGAFAHAIMATGAGHRVILIGIGAGFLFALAVLSISIVSFPLLLDRDVGVEAAIRTSWRVMWRNPLAVAAWGAVVAGGLVVGSLPFLVGLAIVLPVLGHATWHLYRLVLPRAEGEHDDGWRAEPAGNGAGADLPARPAATAPRADRPPPAPPSPS